MLPVTFAYQIGRAILRLSYLNVTKVATILKFNVCATLLAEKRIYLLNNNFLLFVN
ncbi:hypothetical protein SAMN06265367_10143 [Algoriphagus winogradskyi]|uniref:Uncharacterized protein n=1 Tax=Algoriphagus winogradskyi TaxID=237017 RepID=A0ABY1N7K1_9BACT|nr:hypothetical protein SAMN06265367_10143 [Algoriphagus winogradskyi]